MRSRLTAILLDNHKDEHDYSTIKTEKLYGYEEEGFDIIVVEDINQIIKTISDNRGYDCIVSIGLEFDYKILNEAPFEVRKKWIHFNEFDGAKITEGIINCFLGNINRKRKDGEKLFSIFTPTYNTPEDVLLRLYNSLCVQTYNNWDWWILDDSTNDNVTNLLDNLNDPRIFVIKNHSNHGNIGFNKHIIAMAADGDYLVEVDHDDRLTSDCLEYLNKAFKKYPNTDFVYSDDLEIMNGEIISYGEHWGHGEGWERMEIVEGQEVKVCATPYVTPYSCRSIHLQPNHVRCWKSEFYHKIGGHNYDLSVLDDMDILCRTFLYGKITKVNKALYVQYEGDGERGKDATTAQSTRFGEIQRTDEYLKRKYDKDIHQRILKLGHKDTAWNDSWGGSYLWKEHKISEIMNNNIYEEKND